MKSAINAIKGIFILLLLLLLLFIFLSFRSFSYSKTETPGIPLGAEPHDIAINPETDTAVITLKGDGHHHSESGYASVVDLATQTVISEVPVGRKPTAVAIDNELNIALVGNSKDDTLSVIDLNSLEVTATIATGRSPEGIAVNPLTHIALVANHKDDTVSVIDLMTYEVIATVPVGREPVDVAIDPELNIALVVNEKGDKHKHKHEKDKDYTVSVIDLATYEVTGEIRVGRKPQAVDINPETHLAVVANEKDSSITVIDLLNYQTDSVAVCKHPVDAAINPLNNRALVLCDGERVLQLIDLDTSSIVKEYSINKKSEAVAVNPYTNIAGVVDEKTDSLTLIQLPNPVPDITSITPETILRGSSATKVTVTGSGFLKSSIVSILTPTTHNLTPTFFDNHNLEVEVPEELLQETGIYEITVTNPAPEGGESNALELTVENPAPTISAIDPATVVAGATGLTINVHGTGFFADTVVYVDGAQRGFSLISQTGLEILLTASELDTGGYLEIRAFNPPPGGGGSNVMVFTVLNPIPTLSSINPNSVKAGAPGFTLTLSGSNLVKTSTVSFDNQQYAVTYISPTQIEATIPASAIQTPGEYPVKVINPAPGGGESSAVVFTVTEPLEVTITSPTDGDVIGLSEIEVQGTVVSFYPVVSVSVNGVGATLSGNNFTATVTLTTGTNTITAQATDSNGYTASTSITVTYEPSETPPPVTGESGYIDGYVYDARTGSPLSGVRITVAGITGQIMTDSEGFFAFPVSEFPPGIPAKEVLLTAEKAGYTYGQRRMVVKSKTDMRVDDIYLVPRDTVTTTVTPDGGTATNSRGNIILEFPQGAVDTPIEVNITEYDSSKELPAPLPETSHFTFAASFQPDGVVFNQPVHLKVENFLGFPPGAPVPVGFYDKVKGAWVADGMGVISDDGQWMEYDLTHFSSFDCNWPVDCIGGCDPPPGGDDGDGCDSATTCCGGSGPGGGAPGGGSGGGGGERDTVASSVGIRDGSLEVDHKIAGYTVLGKDFHLTLRYNSKHVNPQVFIGRTADYDLLNTLPDVIKAEIDFMGEKKTGYFLSSKDVLSFRAFFEARDGRGNELSTGIYPYRITLANRYDTVYYALTREFGGYPEGAVFSVPAREPKYVSKGFGGEVFVRKDKDTFLGKGWSIDGVRRLIETNNKLVMIDGDSYEVFGEDIITTVAGSGYGGDGGPATEARLYNPHGVAVDSAGNIYIADSSNNRIRKVDTSGIITTVAGNGQRGYSGDWGPATEARLYTPWDVAVDNAGNIYIADLHNYRIRKVDISGIITTVAGNGQYGFSGDGGPATEARLKGPFGVAVDGAGNIYIADRANNRIRKVSTDGIITTIAGDGQYSYGGDGGPATDAKLRWPEGVAVDSSGNIYIADTSNDRIRREDTNGIITTVAGNGQRGYSGDWGPASEAAFRLPAGVTVDSSGNIYIADFSNDRIRRVDTNGIITTVAGNGQRGYSGDWGPASEAAFNLPSGVTVDNAGNIYIADSHNHRIRKVTISYNITTPGTAFKSDRNNGTTLTINLDGTYTLRYKDGNTVNFSPEGLQTAVIDHNGNITQYLYDPEGRLTQVTDPAGGVTTLSYTNGYLSSITDPQGRTTAFTTDAQGDLVSITDPDGSTSTYNYNSSHNMVLKTLPGNRTYGFTYDSHGMVSSVILPDGSRKSYKHSTGMGLLNDIASTEANPAPPVITGQLYDEVIDELGNTTKYRTNRHGLAVEKIDALGRVTLTERDKHSRPVKVTRPDGSVIQKTYDEKGNLLTETDALGNTTTYTYDPAFNQIASIKDPKGNTTTFEYDAKGNLIKTTDPSGSITTMTYDARGLLTSVTDANGNTVQYQYDSRGNLIKTIDQLGNETTYSRDATGNISSITDAEGNITSYEYDAMNNLVKVTDASGGITSYTYSSGGVCTTGCTGGTGASLLTSITDASGNVTSFEYDERGGQVKVINPDGTVTAKAYDAKGNLISQTDENGNITGYAYDAVQRLLSVTDPIGGVTGYSYDVLDNLLSVTDANGNVTSYKYDSAKRQLKTISPDTGTTTYSYDANDNLISKTDANGVTVNYTYDSLDRLISANFPDPTENITYSYDNCLNGKGRLCQMTDPSGTTSYEYSARGEVVKETKIIDNITYVTEYSYSPDGSLESMTYPDGRIVTYSYTANKMNTVTTTMDGITKTIVSDIAYTPASLPSAVTYGNGIITDMSYDTRNQLSSLNIGTLKQLSYTRDNAGNITLILDNLNPTKDRMFTYDALYRLTQADGPWGSLNYSYDSVGNRQTETSDTGITKYSYSANRLIASSGEKTFNFSFDANGNTTTEDTKQYIYNQNQRLIEIVESGIPIAEYSYDASKQRVKKIVNGQTTIYLYSLSSHLIAESTETGIITTEYIYLFGKPLAKIENDNVYYYHNDHLDSPMLMTDGIGSVVWEGEFMPFGEVLSITGTITNNLRFPGQYYDDETGLNYNWHRYYSPNIGKYITPDPLRLEGTTNFYHYTYDNPVNAIDPFGLFCIPLPDKEVAVRDIGKPYFKYTLNLVFVDLFGPLVKCIWHKYKVQKQEIEIIERELCCEQSVISKCTFNFLCYIKEGNTRYEYRDKETLVGSATNWATTFSSGRYGDKPDMACCRNPWTGQIRCGKF